MLVSCWRIFPYVLGWMPFCDQLWRLMVSQLQNNMIWPCLTSLVGKTFLNLLRLGFLIVLLCYRICRMIKYMVVNEQWSNWNCAKAQKAEAIVSIVLDLNFWANVKMIIKVWKPILKVLHLTDREGATMGSIYQFKQQLLMDIINMTKFILSSLIR